MSNERLIYIDYVKAIAMIYIVAFWHIDDYAGNLFYSKYTQTITYGCLSVFIFISSFLIVSRYERFNNFQEVVLFLKKRLLRLYPLYFIALLLYMLNNIISIESFIAGTFLTNTFLNINVRTLWFISMLFSYYIILLIILYNFSYKKMFYIVCLIILGSLIVKKYFGLVDIRFFYYLIPFLSGILCAKSENFYQKMTSRYSIFVSIIFLTAITVISNYISNGIYNIIYTLISITMTIPIIISLSRYFDKLIKSSRLQSLLMKLSYVSFSMYIFHRLVYFYLLELYKPENDNVTIIYLLFIGFPTVYFISMYIQSTYDFLLKKYFN